MEKSGLQNDEDAANDPRVEVASSMVSEESEKITADSGDKAVATDDKRTLTELVNASHTESGKTTSSSVTFSLAAAVTLAPGTPFDNFCQHIHIPNQVNLYTRYMTITVPVDPAYLMGTPSRNRAEARMQQHRLDLGNYAPLRLAIGADYQRKASVLYAQEGGFRDNIHRRLWSNVGRTSSMAHRSRGKKELGVSLHMANYYSRVADIVRLESMVHGLFKTEGLWVEPGTAGNTTRHNELFAIDKDTVLRYVVQAVRFMKVFFPSSVQDFVDGLRIFMDIRL
ncbi:hypothetical protein BG003_006225 [Podila horticola]|nr:hypothetical protein BG003_006225 [Podila horticola]